MEACMAEALTRLDTMDAEVTDWEASFLHSLRQRRSYTPKQRQVLAKMVEQYLQDGALAAEILGQQRLWS